jgi:hypothetical protein
MTRRLLPHEILAIVFCLGGIVLLERMPVTYPRSALFLAFASPMLLIFVLASAIAALRDRSRLRENVVGIARCCAPLLCVFATAFLLKSFIHVINPRVYDRQLFLIDRWLHFGFSPTIFLTTLFDNRLFLRGLDLYYTSVYFILFIGVTAALLGLLDAAGRLRFAAAFAMVWMAGTALYLLVPSWGPAFSATPLVERALRSMPHTVWVQRQLYGELASLVNHPLAPRLVRFGSVAAFPSLHVAVLTLFTLALRRLSRLGFVLGLAGAGLMLLGSVITGYHFLIDGEAGALLAAVAWLLARPLTERARSRSDENIVT